MEGIAGHENPNSAGQDHGLKEGWGGLRLSALVRGCGARLGDEQPCGLRSGVSLHFLGRTFYKGM